MFAQEVSSRGRPDAASDVALELVGGAYVAEDLACLADRGRIVVVGTMGGGRVDLDLGMLMRKRAEVRGTMLRSRPLEEKILVARILERQITPLLESGALHPVIDRVLPVASAAEAAHRAMQDNESFGKLVLPGVTSAPCGSVRVRGSA